MGRTLLFAFTLAFFAPARLAPAESTIDAGAGPDAIPPYIEETVLGGEHWRFETPNGPVHVWRPPGYEHHSAGIVVYLHGFYTDVDQAWNDHRLAEQFLASQQNALFIVPEVPTGRGQRLRWHSLGELIRAVRKHTKVKRPWGHIVALGHSGAYRSIVPWLDYRHLDHVILLDGLYGFEDEYGFWLDRVKGHRDNKIILVAADTLRWSEPFVKRYKKARTLDLIPEQYGDFERAALRAKILYMRAQYGHMNLVTDGLVIPVLLRATRLRKIDAG